MAKQTLTAQLDEARTTVTRLEGELAVAKLDTEAARQDRDRSLTELRRRHTEETERIRKCCSRLIAAKEEQYEERIVGLEREHALKVASLQGRVAALRDIVSEAVRRGAPGGVSNLHDFMGSIFAEVTRVSG